MESTAADGEQAGFLEGRFLPAAFRNHSYEVARDTCRYLARGEERCREPPSHACRIMRSLAADTIRQDPARMEELVRVADITRRERLTMVRNVADEMFADDQVNWGRVVTLHAFCGALARHCEQSHVPDCADDIANILGEFVVNRLGLWLLAHGGWASFERQFPVICLYGTSTFTKSAIVLGCMVGAVVVVYGSLCFFR